MTTSRDEDKEEYETTVKSQYSIHKSTWVTTNFQFFLILTYMCDGDRNSWCLQNNVNHINAIIKSSMEKNVSWLKPPWNLAFDFLFFDSCHQHNHSFFLKNIQYKETLGGKNQLTAKSTLMILTFYCVICVMWFQSVNKNQTQLTCTWPLQMSSWLILLSGKQVNIFFDVQ